MRRPTTLLAVVAFVAAAAGGLLGTTPPAVASDRCDGVRVVVDARDAGGSVTSRCAPGDPSSGLRALQEAGHQVTYVPNQPGFVCTLDARPDPCNGAPATAFWSYWHAPAGGTWTYSSTGAGNRDPAPGTVEGWRFGDGSAPPRLDPPANPAPEPEPDTAPAPATPAPDPGGNATTSGDSAPSSPARTPATSESTGSDSTPPPGGTGTPRYGVDDGSPTGDGPPDTPGEPNGAESPSGADPDPWPTTDTDAGTPDGFGDNDLGEGDLGDGDDEVGDGDDDRTSGDDRAAEDRPTNGDEAGPDGVTADTVTAGAASDEDRSWLGVAAAGVLVAGIGGATLHRRRQAG